MDTPLHVLLRTDHRKLKVDSREDFTDTGHLIKPISTYLFDLVWDLRKVYCILILISDDDAVIGVLFRELAHAATDEH